MAIPKTAGLDKRGNPVYLRTPEGFEVLDDELNPIVDDEIRSVGPAFTQWVSDGGFTRD
jgi:hypothetical protein